jgi:hypothetical protein
MELSIPILLLIVFGVAAGGCAIGIWAARRPKIAAFDERTPITVIPDTLADLAMRLAKENELAQLLHTAAEWMCDEYKIPLVVITRHRWELRPAWRAMRLAQTLRREARSSANLTPV